MTSCCTIRGMIHFTEIVMRKHGAASWTDYNQSGPEALGSSYGEPGACVTGFEHLSARIKPSVSTSGNFSCITAFTACLRAAKVFCRECCLTLFHFWRLMLRRCAGGTQHAC